jgi:metal-responsive CopG/Arc/MetJ family transcriptional regulator
MRHSVSIQDEVGEAIEAAAEEEGISISEFYARAAEEHLKRLRRRRAIEGLDRRAGTIDVHGDIEEELDRVRDDDTERP